MGVPMVKSCCCCATLHTGTLVIAYLYTVWTVSDHQITICYDFISLIEPLILTRVILHNLV